MSDKPFIIGITGPIGAGKNTLGNVISDLTGMRQYSFATPVRGIGAIIAMCEDAYLATHEGKRAVNHLGKKNRDLLRLVGDDMVKPHLGEDIWIKIADYCIVEPTVITDVRFPPEAEYVRNRGILIHIEREDNPMADQMSSHASDAGIPFKQGDFVIKNNGDILDLVQRAWTVILMNERLRDITKGYSETQYLEPF